MKMDKPRLIGLTGGIASGKSLVAGELSRLGLKVISADAIAKELAQPGKPCLRKITRAFGKTVMLKNGALDRKKLASIVFSSKQKRRLLEKITHPAIIREINLRAAKYLKYSGKPVIVEAPLIFEAHLEKMFDQIIVVWAPEKLQLKRLKNRDKIGMASALNRLRAQIPLNRKIKLADHVIDNSKTPAATRKYVKNIYNRLTKT